MKRKVTAWINLCIALMVASGLTAQVNGPVGKPEFGEIQKTGLMDKSGNLQVKAGQTVDSPDEYCIPSANCNSGDGFEDFVFAGISNIGSGCSQDGYGDFTGMQGSVEKGNTYTASFKSFCPQQKVSMWIDFDDDAVFSETERVITDFVLPQGFSTFNTDVPIPADAGTGLHRLRIGGSWSVPSSTDPCGTISYGEWEDYTLEVTGGSYCIPSANCNSGDGFEDFVFAGISNIGSGCSPNGYGDFTGLTGIAEMGQTYTASFKTGYGGQKASLWIDFNDDEIFADFEQFITDFDLPGSNTSFSTDVTIPASASVGIHRLRIGACWNAPSSPDPCATFQYGEWEDYTIEITGTPANYNAAVVSIDIDSYSPFGEIIPKATVGNFSIEEVSFPVTMTEPSTGYSSTVQVTNLGVGEMMQVEFDSWNVPVGTYTIEACTELEGDELPQDDCLEKSVNFINMNRQMVLLEVATGTWCQWCPAAQNGCDDLLMNWKNVAVVEHHNLNEDPFMTEFSTYRVETMYYMYAYPFATFDGRVAEAGGGSSTGTEYGYYLPKVDTCMSITAPVTMSMDVTHTGNDYTAVITINKEGDISSVNNAVHFFVTQSNIEYSWQGMTTVEHVNRLMVPDQYGTPVDFSSGPVQVVTLNFTMDTEWSLVDCEFVACLQNMDPDQGYQSGIPGYPNQWVVYQTIKQGAIDLNVDFTASADTIVPGTTVNFSNLTHGGYVNTPEIYQWHFPGATPDTSTLKDPSVIYENSGNYDVTLIVNRGWQIDTLTIENAIYVESGIEILEKSHHNVTIYPNPASERVSIKSDQLIKNIEIYNQYGQLVRRFDTNFQNINLNISGLVTGLYFVKLQMDSEIVTKSIVIK